MKSMPALVKAADKDRFIERECVIEDGGASVCSFHIAGNFVDSFGILIEKGRDLSQCKHRTVGICHHHAA